ncbi:MAG TPA: sigma-70 family RNA polymerase sigma factor [Acidimicrobiales bacterium]|nr:sigma-70 family RNA polymerase sigma factor [Acidimicrobiales bacterium]
MARREPDVIVAEAADGGTAVADDFEPYRRELTGYCYRMLGSGSEADDAVQETLVRAWRNADSFEGRSSVRTWLYRIASNVCIDMGRAVQRRARPMDLATSSPPDETLLGPPRPELPWISPVAGTAVGIDTDGPEASAVQHESLRLAFITALQHLPAKQRAALILCDVLEWSAAGAAELLDTSTAAVNSALQRARATMAGLPAEYVTRPLDADAAELVSRYVEAFEHYDIDTLVTLLHDDAIQTMPPFELWIRGAHDIGAWMVEPGPSACRGSRLIATSANGCPAFGQYRVDPDGGYAPWALQVLEISEGRIAEMHFFLALGDPSLFSSFGLPAHLDA